MFRPSTSPLLILLVVCSWCHAQVTIYTQLGSGTTTATAPSATFTGGAAYDPTTLTPPPAPQPPSTGFAIQLTTGGMPGLSVPQSGAFMGFSIELSVINQVMGRNSSLLQVPFLNLLGNIKARAGYVRVRVGGNTQERAIFHPEGLPGGVITMKNKTDPLNPLATPNLDISIEMIQMMANISSLVNVRWVVGFPFANINPPQMGIVEAAKALLSPYLEGIQLGNEPDRYTTTQYRDPTYNEMGYFNDFGAVVQALEQNPNVGTRMDYIGGSVCCNWTPEQVWDTGFIDTYTNVLGALAVEHYPANNCQKGAIIAQDLFPSYLNHSAVLSFVQPYINSAQLMQSKGKPFYLLETNTASCGGFPGISNSFGAALWGIDHALNLAAHNFSGANFHTGGQSVYYNPFTPPPTNQSTFRQWTVGATYYSSLIVAEVLGSTNKSQIIDLNANTGNPFTPAYAIYEDGQPTRVALFNYVTDPSGASDYTVGISVGGGNVGQENASPPQVRARYFTAPSGSVSDIQGFFWANQTFGENFQSDGRLMGDKFTDTITCDSASNTCNVKVKAPSFALVFLSDTALQNSEPVSDDQISFSTTAFTKTINTVTIDQAVLATSNGRGGLMQGMGSTSPGRFAQASTAIGVFGPSLLMVLSVSVGGGVAMLLLR